MPAPTEPEHLVLFEASPTPMLLVDHEEGVIMDANPAAWRFYGFAPDQMRGMPLTALSPSAPERVRRVAQQGETRAVRFTVDHRLATGEVVPVDVAAAPVHVGGRRLVHSVIRPASETSAEERLAEARASERRYRDLVEHLGAGVVQFDPAGRPTWTNLTLADMLGYPDTATLLAARDAVLDEGEATRWDQACLAELRAAGEIRLDLAMRHRDGRRVIGEMHARLLPDGTIEAVIHDVTEQREAQAALAASEERYRLLVEQAFDGVFVIGPDGHLVQMNDRAAEIIGIPPGRLDLAEELQRTALVHQPSARSVAVERLAAGEVAMGDATLVRPDGRVIRVEQRAHRRPDGSTVAVIRDVTEAREAQEALERSEARTRRLLESAPDQVVEIDADGRIAYANPAVARDTGFAAEALLGRDAMDFVDPRDRASLADDRDRILAGGAAVREYRLVRADGESTWVEARTHGLPGGGAETIARVIDDRKALEAERDRLAIALDQCQDPVILTDAHAVTLYVNRALERVAGVDRGAVLGRSALAWAVPAVVDPAAAAAARAALYANGQWSGDLRVRRADGAESVLAARVSRINDARGEPVAVLAIATDVTRERAQAERLAAAAKAEAIGRLAGAIAHDFNNLLTGVLGYAELAASAPAGDPSLAADLGGLVAAAQRAELLTRQLLAFGRRSILHPRAVDPASVILGVEPMLQRLAGPGVRVVIDAAAGATGWIDPGLLEIAVVGLVENARDAMPDGGTVRIEVGPPEERDDAPAGAWTAIRVSDTGEGMAPDVLDRVMDPSYSTKQPGGMGLGLPMANGFMEQSRGHLRVVSTPDAGTTVTMLLPAAAPEVEAPAPADAPWPASPIAPVRGPASPPGAAPAASTTSGPRTILVVDDERVLRTIAERVLTLAGHRVIVAASAEEALAIAEDPSRPIDLLFTDIVMPGMHGTTLARRMAEDRPGLRVLITSGYTAEEMDRDGSLAGHVFLPKPYLPTELTAAVSHLLEADQDAPAEA